MAKNRPNPSNCVPLSDGRTANPAIDYKELLLESESRYSRICAAITDYIYVVDLENGAAIKTTHGEACFAITGYSSQEFVSDPYLWFKMVVPDDREMVNAHTAAILSGRDPGPLEHRIKRKDGSVCWVENTPVLNFDAAGKLKRYDGLVRDITERMHSIKLLSDACERTRMYMDVASVILVAIDTKGTITMVNQRGCAILGRSEAELKGKNWFETCLPPSEYPRVMAVFNKMMSGEIANLEYFENSIIRPDSTQRLIAWNNKIMYSSDGVILGSLSSGEDITDRKAAQMALVESEARFRAIVESTPMGIHLYNLNEHDELVFSGANPAADKILGIDHRQFIGKKILEAFPSLKETGIPEQYVRVALTGQQWTTQQVAYKDNRVSGAFDVFAFKVSDRLMAAKFSDVTKRIQEQHELANEKERLAVTLRSIGDGVITTDIDGNVVLMNHVAEKLTGWQIADAAGRSLSEVFHIINEKTRLECENPAEKVIKSGSIVGLANHTVLLSRDGRELIIADSGAPIRNDKGEIIGVVLVFRDITEKQKLEATMQNAAKLESVGLLAGGIAHDFNNLLSGLFGYIDLAKAVLPDADAARGFLEKSFMVFNRAKDLTEQLLTFSKGGTPKKRTVAIGSLLRENIAFVLSGSSVTPEFSIAEDLYYCDLDANQFGQVVDNIAINARQAMPIGGKIEIAARNITDINEIPAAMNFNRCVKISICDYGTGIPQEHLSKIFDPFFTTKQKGSGLGLATAYSIISRHEGHIEVESKLGKGTTFHIYLPASNSDQMQSESVQISKIKRHGMILVMDDEKSILEVVRWILGQLGFIVTCVSNGTEAISAFKKAIASRKKFDVAIMDLTIPGGMGGKETLDILKELDPHIIAIASSGYSDDPIMSEPEQFGFAASLNKPYRREDLINVLVKVFS